MPQASISMDWQGLTDLGETLNALGVNMKVPVEMAMEQAKYLMDTSAYYDMVKHTKPVSKWSRTGNTQKSIMFGDEVVWDGYEAEVGVGFDVRHGGLASVFIMYGTPKHMIGNWEHPGVKADKKLYNDFFGSKAKKQVRDTMTRAFESTIREALRRSGG